MTSYLELISNNDMFGALISNDVMFGVLISNDVIVGAALISTNSRESAQKRINKQMKCRE